MRSIKEPAKSGSELIRERSIALAFVRKVRDGDVFSRRTAHTGCHGERLWEASAHPMRLLPLRFTFLVLASLGNAQAELSVPPAGPQAFFRKPAPALQPGLGPDKLSPSATAIYELSLQPTLVTPYDRYAASVRTVIAEIDGMPATMADVCRRLKEAYAFRYEEGDPYRAASPEITSLIEAGDCKAKSLWLYNRLGDPGALYVIGKLARGEKKNHAWVYWRSDERWWILDPTNRAEPILAESVGPNRYLPHYSFGPGGTFRHPSTQHFMAPSAVVATRKAMRSGH